MSMSWSNEAKKENDMLSAFTEQCRPFKIKFVTHKLDKLNNKISYATEATEINLNNVDIKGYYVL